MDWEEGLETGSTDYIPQSVGITPEYNFNMPQLPGDVEDSQRMQPYTSPAAGEGAPWWQSLVKYGMTKAIDNALPTDPRGMMGNTYPGSVGGINGRTYTQIPNAVGGTVGRVYHPSPFGALAQPVMGFPLWMLAAAAYFLMRK